MMKIKLHLESVRDDKIVVLEEEVIIQSCLAATVIHGSPRLFAPAAKRTCVRLV